MTGSRQFPITGGKRVRQSDGQNHPAEPLFSIVTIVLNDGDKLDRTIGSVLAQEYREFEYVVVDGGSTDVTPEILNKYDDRLDFWISDPDNGISDAFNRGIGLARGEIVGLLNAGDWYERETLATVAEAFREHPDVEVCCGSIEFWEKSSPVLFCHSNPEVLRKQPSIYHPTVFIRKSAYMKYGLYDIHLKYAMDYELLLRFSLKGARILTIPKKLVNMPLDGVSQSHWYAGLSEVRQIRSRHFNVFNVGYYHSLAVLKNLSTMALSGLGLRKLHRVYWSVRNSRSVGQQET